VKSSHGLLGLFLGLSILLHLSVLLAELVQQWLWIPKNEEIELRETMRTLRKQEIGDARAALEGVKPAEAVMVFLRSQTEPVLVAPPPPPTRQRIKSVKPAKPRPKPVPTPMAQAEVVIASAPALAVPAVAASAPQPEVASPPMVASRTESAPVAEAVARFPNEVKISYRWGFYLADMVWKVENGRYDVAVEGSGLGAFYRYFRSSGRLDARGVWPEQFIEYRERSHAQPEFQLDFDHDTRMVIMGAPGKRKMEVMGEADKDVFAAAFHLALMGGAQDEYVMTVYTGRRRYENVNFKIAGEATLSLGEQKIDAILLRGQWENRRFDFWLAPEWNNLPVRMNIVVPDRGSFDLWAQDLSIDGKTVLEWTPPQTE
jgi:hypothetical protein